MRIPAIVIAAVLALSLALPASAKESSTFRKWTYVRDKTDNGEVLRIYAGSEAQDAPGGMLLYRDPAKCGSPLLMFIANTKKKGEAAEGLQGMLRVDEKPVHQFKYKVAFPENNGLAVVNIADLNDPGALFDEMRQGTYLRVKLSVHGADYVMRIPLAGYVEADAKQLEVCTAMAGSSGKKPGDQAQGENKGKEKRGGFGTGFFVNEEGYVVTNFHVVNAGKKIVCDYQNNKYDAKVVKVDHINDLALLKLDVQPKAYLNFREGKPIRTGEAVVAVGFPFYGLVSTHPNITNGTVSSAVGIGDDTRWLQISAPVQPGNSGGPLLDSSGNLVGVVCAGLDSVAFIKATGDVPQNMNYAIRIPLVKSFLEVNEVAYHSAESTQDLKVVDIGDKTLPGVVLVEALPQEPAAK